MAETARNVFLFSRTTKRCPRCKAEMPVEAFSRNKKYGFNSYCKRCASEASLERYYVRNPDRPTKSKNIDYANKRRHCLGCGEIKPWQEFNSKAGRGGVPASKCHPCRAKESREHRQNNLDKFLKKELTFRLKQKYGMTISDYTTMLSAQDNKCKICLSGSSYKKSGLFVVDHSHESGVVRGLLCTRCNSALGMFGDEPERLRLAAKYIEKDGKI